MSAYGWQCSVDIAVRCICAEAARGGVRHSLTRLEATTVDRREALFEKWDPRNGNTGT